jgi:hypothetical protein
VLRRPLETTRLSRNLFGKSFHISKSVSQVSGTSDASKTQLGLMRT